MTNIYLIRHGFTPANNASYNNQRGLRKISEDRYMPLDKEYGIKQAEELGMFLSTIKGNSLILVSPYNRTRETLNIALNYMHGNYEIRVEEELREIYSGIHYAKTKEELLEEYPDAIKFYEDFTKDPFNTKYIDGESKNDIKERTVRIAKEINEICNSNKYDNIFIFAHGEVNKWIYYNINGELYNISQKNCEVIKGNGKDKGMVIFTPKCMVPKGYMVNIDEYYKK